MTLYQQAQNLARKGFYVFPLPPNKKTPPIKDFIEVADCNPNNLKRFWFDPVLNWEWDNNIGISTSRFITGALLVIDIDNKKGKNGSKTLQELKAKGLTFPKTLVQTTPTGGFHIIYSVKKAVKQGTDVLGSGLDIRSRGGYIVGAGSEIDGKKYTIDNTPITSAPDWLIQKCNQSSVSTRKAKVSIEVNQEGAEIRAKDYLLNRAELSFEGQGGDDNAFKVANRLKDLGIDEANCFELMLDYWNDRCSPPWAPEELEKKIGNAYAYGQNQEGCDSPENDFKPIKMDIKDEEEEEVILSPVEKLNKRFAFIVLGGKSRILQKTNTGEINTMVPQAFHDLINSEMLLTGEGKFIQLSKVWFKSSKRETYKAMDFYPMQQAPEGVYNLWSGFNCTPLGDNERPTPDMIEGVRLFKEHTLENVCLNNKDLYAWLMGYFAHLVQKPYEKALTALVFKGKKGVGKNALIERIGKLFKTPHYMLASDRRYIVGNFNKHLSTLLFFVLDEARWSGDKDSEGRLKDLITGSYHTIEQKGIEVYTVKNLLRVCILGNEDWLVPASGEERRFAVFNIGDNRKQDNAYFKKMRILIDNKGGNRLLLRELMGMDITNIDVNAAPKTEALLEQKIETLSPIHSWWHSCLSEGVLLSGSHEINWPQNIRCTELRGMYIDFAKKRGVTTWHPTPNIFSKQLRKCILKLKTHQFRDKNEHGKTCSTRYKAFILPSLDESRKLFDKYIGHKVEWDEDALTEEYIFS